MGTVWAELDRVIDGLSQMGDIDAAAVVRRDGFIIVHTLPNGVDPKVVAAMTASIVGISEMATEQLSQGLFLQAIIESESGKLVSTGAGEMALLVALVHRDANLGLVLFAMERAARSVDEVLRRSEGR